MIDQEVGESKVGEIPEIEYRLKWNDMCFFCMMDTGQFALAAHGDGLGNKVTIRVSEASWSRGRWFTEGV